MMQAAAAVIIPVYNPSNEWATHLIERYQAFCDAVKEDIQLVLVNDGSTNKAFDQHIHEITTAFPNSIVLSNTTNRGKGFTLRKAVAAVEATLYIVTDVDIPYTTESMVAVYQALQSSNTDIAAGNRNKEYYQQINGFRKTLSLSLRRFIRKQLKLTADDTQCGMKGFNSNGKELFLATTINRYLYDLELMVKACNHPTIRLTSVPVQLRKGISLGTLPIHILLQESGNLIKILLHKNK